MSFVTVTGLFKYYGQRPILERVNLEVSEGEFISLVGASGCGKSTFLRMLLDQESPSRGSITVDGEPLTGEPCQTRGIVFQRYSVFPHMTVRDNIVAASSFRTRLGWLSGAGKRVARAEADSALDRIGLAHVADQYPAALSGGMQQRLAIAQAMAAKPRILLLDEPFGALDPGTRMSMHAFLQELRAETGMTVFMVTHDLEKASSSATGFSSSTNRAGTPTIPKPMARRSPTTSTPATAAFPFSRSRRRPMFPFPNSRSRSHHPADQRRDGVRHHHPDLSKLMGWKAMRKEADIPDAEWEKEKAWALRMGLTAADSIEDRSIPTFARGELPHYAGINTFLKAPYTEDVTEVGNYDATVLGAPFDGGTTYRPGTRFGPQGLRKISALYTPYNYEIGVDLREEMSLCDAGDIFTIPANIEKTFDQISRAVSHVFSSGSMPIIIGGDHSIGFPCVRGIAQCTSKKIGIVHFDRHADIQEKDLDERMHTTPWFHSTNLPNVPAKNLVQVGIGGWQVPREAVKVARERETNIITMGDMEKMGIDRTAEMALEMAWDGVDMVYMSFDIDSIDCGFVPGTGWPEPGGFLPREALALASKVAAEGICGMELVEVSPPYDQSEITALMGTRVIVDVLGPWSRTGRWARIVDISTSR